MNIKLPQNDPISVYKRKVIAARRIGENARCACGETRPEALVTNSEPTVCAECQRKKRGQTIMDNHHPAGKTNNPATVPVPVNDHRAFLNVAQYDWPKPTRENPEGCPLLAAAGCIRGVIDYLHYLIDKFLRWIPEMLEMLSAFLKGIRGPKWWGNTPLAQFAPKS